MDDLELALALADRADAITMRRFGEAGLGVRAKPDRSLVTEVDTEVEAALRAFLAEHRPSDTVLGEESGGAGSGGRRWVLDPLDHTNNYVRGLPVFATLIALEEDGEVHAGVASAPAMARRWWASRGRGAYADGERIRVSAVADLPDAHVTFAALHRWERRDLTSALAKITEAARYEWGSGGFWGQMLVAEGRCVY
ncbi:inositol monophosphatase family protein [Spirillospora sp. CA-294931]|uniref:inositol monophosphatase family protein n=1 Tax=Spirillospora sp. CA-294931 TaxID=3240042 RepID=UPI003D8B14DC